MRSREFLFEYDRDKTIEQMGTAIANTAKLDNPRIKDEELAPEQIYALSQNVLSRIESVDPTPNKKYVLWVVRQFVKNGLKLEDINEFLRNDIQDFHELPKQRKQQLGVETDINRYNWRDLREIATKLKKSTDLEEPVDAKLDYEHIDDMKVLYVGDMGQLLIPQTEAASCEIGSGTRWCTAATQSDNMFRNYSKQGPLYVWIPSRKMREKKISNKFQFHFETAQFMDENDEQIESELIRYFRNEHPVLKKLFAKGEEVIAQDSSWAFGYARIVIEGRWPEGEEAIAQAPLWAYYYARQVIEGRWPEPHRAEAEANIKKNAVLWKKYVDFVKNSDKIDEDISSATDNEYDELTQKNFAHKSQQVVDLAKQSKQALQAFYPNGELKTMKSGTGNFVTQWYETPEEIFLIGINSKSRRLLKNDIEDVKTFINMLISAMQSGKTLITSPHKKSMQMLNNVQKIAEKRGLTFSMDVSDSVSFGDDDPELEFFQVQATIN